MSRKKIIVFAVLATAFLVVTLMSGRIARRVLLANLEEATGMQVMVGEVDVQMRNRVLRIVDLHFVSGDSFPDREAVHVAELRVQYRGASLFTRRPHLTDVLLHIPRAVLVTREDGVTNLQPILSLASPVARPSSPASVETPAPHPLEDMMAEIEGRPAESEKTSMKTPVVKPEREGVRIDRLTIKLGEIETRDYSRGRTQPRVRNYKLNLEQVYVDVTDTEELANRIAMDFGILLAPLMLEDLTRSLDINTEALVETITSHEGDLEELGKKLDAETKELQRELRRQRRALLDQLKLDE